MILPLMLYYTATMAATCTMRCPANQPTEDEVELRGLSNIGKVHPHFMGETSSHHITQHRVNIPLLQFPNAGYGSLTPTEIETASVPESIKVLLSCFCSSGCYHRWSSLLFHPLANFRLFIKYAVDSPTYSTMCK